MGIETAFLDRLVAVGTAGKIFPGGSVLILGDCRFHTRWATGDNAADLEKFKELYGLQRVETVDAAGQPSILWDLHQPIPESLRNQFDMIVDAGTLFWCFDVAAVMKNCLDMLKDAGTMVHVSALTGYFGPGYYNLRPSLFRDFYQQNEFELIEMAVQVHKHRSPWARWHGKWRTLLGRPIGQFETIGNDAIYLVEADYLSMKFSGKPTSDASMLPPDSLIFCAARRSERNEFVRPLPYPKGKPV